MSASSTVSRVVVSAFSGVASVNGVNGAVTIAGATVAGQTVTLTPSFSDAVFELYDNADSTKKVVFQISGVTTGTTRTLTAPNASGTLALTSDLSAYAPLANPTFTGSVNLSASGVELTESGFITGAGTNFDVVAGVLEMIGDCKAGTFTPTVKPTVSGSTGGNVALQNLLAAIATIGLITNSTS